MGVVADVVVIDGKTLVNVLDDDIVVVEGFVDVALKKLVVLDVESDDNVDNDGFGETMFLTVFEANGSAFRKVGVCDASLEEAMKLKAVDDGFVAKFVVEGVAVGLDLAVNVKASCVVGTKAELAVLEIDLFISVPLVTVTDGVILVVEVDGLELPNIDVNEGVVTDSKPTGSNEATVLAGTDTGPVEIAKLNVVSGLLVKLLLVCGAVNLFSFIPVFGLEVKVKFFFMFAVKSKLALSS